jgi:hypothetical protein
MTDSLSQGVDSPRTVRHISLSVSEAARLTQFLEATRDELQTERAKADVQKLLDLVFFVTEEFPSEFVRVPSDLEVVQ